MRTTTALPALDSRKRPNVASLESRCDLGFSTGCQFDVRNVTFISWCRLGEQMSEEQPPGSPENPDGPPPEGPAAQPRESNPQGPKPFWRRTPFLVVTPP